MIISPEENWIICEWPDGTWCNEESLEGYLKFMSDDFRRLRVLECDGEYTPTKTEPVS